MTETSFQTAYERWQSAQFPKGSRDDDLDDLHSDLAHVDAVVADCAIPYATEGRHAPVPVPVVEQLDEMIERATRLEAADDADNAALATSYREYGELLKAVVAQLPTS